MPIWQRSVAPRSANRPRASSRVRTKEGPPSERMGGLFVFMALNPASKLAFAAERAPGANLPIEIGVHSQAPWGTEAPCSRALDSERPLAWSVRNGSAPGGPRAVGMAAYAGRAPRRSDAHGRPGGEGDPREEADPPRARLQGRAGPQAHGPAPPEHDAEGSGITRPHWRGWSRFALAPSLTTGPSSFLPPLNQPEVSWIESGTRCPGAERSEATSRSDGTPRSGACRRWP
jgi:hypothetical protein